jgi:hypothetical protein
MYEYTAPYCGAARRDSTVLYTYTAHAAVLWYGLLDSVVLRYCLLYSVVLSQVLLVRLVLRYGLSEFAVLFRNLTYIPIYLFYRRLGYVLLYQLWRLIQIRCIRPRAYNLYLWY